MNPAEIIMHVVERDSVHVVLNLLAEGVRQTCESAHAHSHGEVLPFNVAR